MSASAAIPHEPGVPQSWATADAEIRGYVEHVVVSVAAALEPNGFVGAYLHGSFAMGSFYRPKSDIDILVVVERDLDPQQRERLAQQLCDLSDARPTVGGLEVSVVHAADTRHFRQPLQYEVHYSLMWHARIRAGTVDFAATHPDPEIAPYCHVIRTRGACLRGRAISEVFGPIPVEAVRGSILDDFAWIIDGDHIVEAPFYGVLNVCRVLRLEAEGWDQVVSKDEGGMWALARLPEVYQPLIAQALTCYRSCETVVEAELTTDGHAWDIDSLRAFRDYARDAVHPRTGVGGTSLVEIETDHLRLRPFRADDAAAFDRFARAAEYRRYLGADHPGPHAFVANNVGIDGAWVVELGGQVVGAVFLGHELACLIDPEHHGHGVGTEAAIAVIDDGFHRRGYDTIIARADPANTASVRGLARLGFHMAGGGRYVLDRATWSTR
jgi:streptomycin 3"-adenylyltransferase